mgnify:CR=1 FL=1
MEVDLEAFFGDDSFPIYPHGTIVEIVIKPTSLIASCLALNKRPDCSFYAVILSQTDRFIEIRYYDINFTHGSQIQPILTITYDEIEAITPKLL